MVCFSVVSWLRRFAKVGPKSEVVRRIGCPRSLQNLHHACARERFGSRRPGALLEVDIDKICTTPARQHATRNASFQTLFKSTTPANVLTTLTNSCACHVFCNVSKSLRLPRETHFERQKTSRDRQFLTILTSKSLSRTGVVQILRNSTSKSPPKPSVFNDFDFQIVLARRRGANFVDVNFQKCSRHASF